LHDKQGIGENKLSNEGKGRKRKRQPRRMASTLRYCVISAHIIACLCWRDKFLFGRKLKDKGKKHIDEQEFEDIVKVCK